MKPVDILKEYYKPESESFDILLQHSRLVADKALETAKRVAYLNPDLTFIEEAAMLHDIGIFMTDAPQIGCHGEHPYIFHGYLGGKILKGKGLHQHALVCERHPGAGISARAIQNHRIGLPVRDMVPVSIEEQIICFADKFYSKKPESLGKEISVADILNTLSQYGEDQVPIFESWLKLFQYN